MIDCNYNNKYKLEWKAHRFLLKIITIPVTLILKDCVLMSSSNITSNSRPIPSPYSLKALPTSQITLKSFETCFRGLTKSLISGSSSTSERFENSLFPLMQYLGLLETISSLICSGLMSSKSGPKK